MGNAVIYLNTFFFSPDSNEIYRVLMGLVEKCTIKKKFKKIKIESFVRCSMSGTSDKTKREQAGQLSRLLM